MASKSAHKIIGQLSQPQYGLLRSLTDGQPPVDAASLENGVKKVVNDRFVLARGFIEAARTLARSDNPLVRRSAVSRAYYAAYHSARATLFEIRRHDEPDHEALPQVIDSIVEGKGDILKELRRLRNEMDYSPYPGPNAHTEYDEPEIEEVIRTSVERAEEFINALERHLIERQ